MRYFAHIKTSNDLLEDWEGEEFDTADEANDYGKRIACEIRVESPDRHDAEVWIVDVHGIEISRHQVHQRQHQKAINLPLDRKRVDGYRLS